MRKKRMKHFGMLMNMSLELMMLVEILSCSIRRFPRKKRAWKLIGCFIWHYHRLSLSLSLRISGRLAWLRGTNIRSAIETEVFGFCGKLILMFGIRINFSFD